MGVLQEAGSQEGEPHRPARRFAFDKERYDLIQREKHNDILRDGVTFDF